MGRAQRDGAMLLAADYSVTGQSDQTVYRSVALYCLQTWFSFCMIMTNHNYSDVTTQGRICGELCVIKRPPKSISIYPYPYIRIKIPVDKSQREYMQLK